MKIKDIILEKAPLGDNRVKTEATGDELGTIASSTPDGKIKIKTADGNEIETTKDALMPGDSGTLKMKPPGSDSMKPGTKVVSAEDMSANEDAVPSIPPMPDITGLQPGQSKDLGDDGEAVTLNRDSTVSLSGGFGTIVYSSQGKPLKYMLPRMGGLGKTIDLTTNKATTSYNAGPMNITQGPDGEVDAEYDFGTAKAKMPRDAQGKTTSSLTARESTELETIPHIAGLK